MGVLGAVALLGACREQKAPGPGGPNAGQVQTLPAAAPQPMTGANPGAAVPRKTTGQYEATLRVEAPGGDREGAEGLVIVHLEARDGFHVNAEYPLSFRPTKGTGVRFPEERFMLHEVVQKVPCAEGSEDICRVEARLPFKVTGGREHSQAEGVLAFSVCNPEQCLIEKALLGAPVPTG